MTSNNFKLFKDIPSNINELHLDSQQKDEHKDGPETAKLINHLERLSMKRIVSDKGVSQCLKSSYLLLSPLLLENLTKAKAVIRTINLHNLIYLKLTITECSDSLASTVVKVLQLLSSVNNLRKLEVHFSNHMTIPTKIIDQVVQLIHRNPGLKTLKVENVTENTMKLDQQLQPNFQRVDSIRLIVAPRLGTPEALYKIMKEVARLDNLTTLKFIFPEYNIEHLTYLHKIAQMKHLRVLYIRVSQMFPMSSPHILMRLLEDNPAFSKTVLQIHSETLQQVDISFLTGQSFFKDIEIECLGYQLSRVPNLELIAPYLTCLTMECSSLLTSSFLQQWQDATRAHKVNSTTKSYFHKLKSLSLKWVNVRRLQIDRLLFFLSMLPNIEHIALDLNDIKSDRDLKHPEDTNLLLKIITKLSVVPLKGLHLHIMSDSLVSYFMDFIQHIQDMKTLEDLTLVVSTPLDHTSQTTLDAISLFDRLPSLQALNVRVPRHWTLPTTISKIKSDKFSYLTRLSLYVGKPISSTVSPIAFFVKQTNVEHLSLGAANLIELFSLLNHVDEQRIQYQHDTKKPFPVIKDLTLNLNMPDIEDSNKSGINYIDYELFIKFAQAVRIILLHWTSLHRVTFRMQTKTMFRFQTYLHYPMPHNLYITNIPREPFRNVEKQLGLMHGVQMTYEITDSQHDF